VLDLLLKTHEIIRLKQIRNARACTVGGYRLPMKIYNRLTLNIIEYASNSNYFNIKSAQCFSLEDFGVKIVIDMS